jgi:hypothetical protein
MEILNGQDTGCSLQGKVAWVQSMVELGECRLGIGSMVSSSGS